MMLYVIPFILLLIVAVVLKKREAGQKDKPSSNKAAAKKTAKKNTEKANSKASAKSTKDTIEYSTASEPAASKTTPIAADLRKQIEERIKSRNFFAAEAEINQALNRDPSQHELYLFLLQVHLEQKDDFSTQKLMDHLRELGLDDIVQQAEALQHAHQQTVQLAAAQKAVVIPATPSEPADFTPAKNSSSSTVTAASFDALVQPSKTNTSFEQLQAELTPVKSEPATEATALEFNLNETTAKAAEPAVEVAPLEFNLNGTTAKAAEPAVEATALEFNLNETTAKAAEPAAEAIALEFNLNETAAKAEPAAEATVLEFNLNETAAKVAAEATALEFNLNETAAKAAEPAAEATVLEFNLNETAAKVAAEATALEFNLNETAAKAAEPAAEATALEFNLNETTAKAAEPVLEFQLDAPAVENTPVLETPAAQVESKTETSQPLEFSFSLDPAPSAMPETVEIPAVEVPAPVVSTPEAKVAEPEFNLNFASFETSAPSSQETTVVSEPALEAASASLPSSLELNLDTLTISSEAVPEIQLTQEEAPVVAAASTVVADNNDPLAQSFPELLHVNEINLNFELAQQYIKFGAYSQARRLLSENEAQLSPEQRAQSEQLLKQIAS